MKGRKKVKNRQNKEDKEISEETRQESGIIERKKETEAVKDDKDESKKREKIDKGK